MNHDELIEFHQQWLLNPVTQQLKTLMKQREQQYIVAIGKAAGQDNNDHQLRNLGNQLRTVQADMELIFNTTVFVNKVNEGKQ